MGKSKEKVSKAIKKFVEKKIAEEPEMKQFTTVYTGGTYANTGQILSIFQPQQGSAQGQRSSNQIRLRGLEIRLINYLLNATATQQAMDCRFIVFADHEPANTILTLANVTGSGGSGQALFATYNTAQSTQLPFDVNSCRKHKKYAPNAQGTRYQILLDKRFTLSPTNNSTNPAENYKEFTWMHNWSNMGLRSNLNTNAGTNADCNDVALYIFTYGWPQAEPCCGWNIDNI